VRGETDPKTVQALLRHANVKATLQLYAHSDLANKMTAQGEALAAILKQPENDGDQSNLGYFPFTLSLSPDAECADENLHCSRMNTRVRK